MVDIVTGDTSVTFPLASVISSTKQIKLHSHLKELPLQ